MRPGQWIVISGIGGLRHIAVQYAKAMGLHVVRSTSVKETLTVARALGADVVVNGAVDTAADDVVKETAGGAHGVLVTAVSTTAFEQALHMVRRAADDDVGDGTKAVSLEAVTRFPGLAAVSCGRGCCGACPLCRTKSSIGLSAGPWRWSMCAPA